MRRTTWPVAFLVSSEYCQSTMKSTTRFCDPNAKFTSLGDGFAKLLSLLASVFFDRMDVHHSTINNAHRTMPKWISTHSDCAA